MSTIEIQSKQCSSYQISIYIAGELLDIRRACRKFCETGLCVTVTPTEFIYTGGSQSGACVGLINYPRFPSNPEALTGTALKLAETLIRECFQDSCSVETPIETFYLSRGRP